MDRILALLLLLSAFAVSPTFAADMIPDPQAPAQEPSQPPADQAQPEVAPSPRDPGMVKQPDTIPHPDSVVHPPEVDPRMAINPEAGSPQAVEPPERRDQDQPPKKHDR